MVSSTGIHIYIVIVNATVTFEFAALALVADGLAVLPNFITAQYIVNFIWNSIPVYPSLFSGRFSLC